MTVPRATIRLQFNRDFTLDAAVETLPYLAALGISHVYASPILAARPGSTHGYDTVDPTQVSPELGGHAALLRLAAALRRQNMGLILDIVPNHMAAVAENPWWWDVLRSGRASRYADFFDIDWDDPDPKLRGKVLLPVLGDSLAVCLERGELRLEKNAETGDLVCRYFDQSYPIDPKCHAEIPEIGAAGREALFRLLQEQNYLLAPWRAAAHRINWRRFFDINRLVALRMERAEVFDAYHRLILDLIRDGVIDGVRIDHIDGLADPTGYCRKLRDALRDAAGPGLGRGTSPI